MTEDLNRGVSQDAGAEAEGAEGASFTGTEGSEQLLGQASVMVARPDPGQTVEISAEPGQTYVLDFNPTEARALVEGDNLILIFEDGSKIVFENLVNLAQLENGPSIQYAGEDLIPTLIAQGIIPGVLDAFDLIAPEPGQTIIIQAALGQRFNVTFDPAIAEVKIDGPDMVFIFPDGGRIVFPDVINLANLPDAPSFYIPPIEVPLIALLNITGTGGEAGPDATATLDTAAGGEGLVGTGGTRYSDDTGDIINTLVASPVIPPVEFETGVPEIVVIDPIFDEPNTPPEADPVLTPAETEGEIPSGLALLLLGPPEFEIPFAFKQLDVNGEIGDDDNFLGPVDMGGADAETALGDLVFTYNGDINYGTVVLESGGVFTIMSAGDTYTSADTVWWLTTLTDIAEFEVVPDATFTYSVTDEDGNVATAPVVITIGGEPSVGEPQATAVDEDLLPGGIEGGPGDIDAGAGTVTTMDTANLDYDFGPDGPGDVSFASLNGDPVVDKDGAAVTSNGDSLVWSWDGATHTLTAVTLDEEPATVLTLQVTNVATGDYKVTLHDVLDHPTADTEDDIIFDLDLVVTDFDGDAAFGTVRVTVDDDTPVATLTDAGGMIVLDETDDDGDDAGPGGDLATVTVLGSALFTDSSVFGSDGPADTDDTVYSLVLTAGATGLTDTLSGEAVVLVDNGGVIEGRTEGSDDLVFTISVNSGTGDVTVVQLRALEHDDPLDDDESTTPEIMASGLVDLEVEVTDGDGDTDTDSIELGSLIKFEDDGPTADLVDAGGMIVLDETDDDGDDAGPGGDLATVTVLGSALFTDSSVFGSDGPADTDDTVYSLVLTAGATGLT
ncbi:MAG: DUF5801 repeats-in-toxin domain-containing protein, partial [Thermoanaerobaculia bacterium]